MRVISLSCAAVFLAVVAFGCGGPSRDAQHGNTQNEGAPQGNTSTQGNGGPQGNDDPPETFDEQAALGHGLYEQNCARCHGANGQGTAEAPRVVGMAEGALPLDPPPGAKLRKTQFRTAADVANFAVHNMPKDAPGSLPASTYWAILAATLKANGVELSQPLGPSNAKDVVLHK